MTINSEIFYDYVRGKQKAIGIFLIVFYTVGIIGMLLPSTFVLFVKLIPFALFLSFVALAFYHKSKIDLKIVFCFLLIYLLAFSIEAVGVNTGKVFGYYEYGNGLGFKIFQTPLIIGINWLFLVYTTSAVVEKIHLPVWVKVVLASTGMLVYDFVLEQVAPKLDMWHWKNNLVPFQNYVAWFVLAVFFHSLIKILSIRVENKLALLILGCQFLFFLSLFILFRLFV
jgi:uncharacterized membrane protein